MSSRVETIFLINIKKERFIPSVQFCPPSEVALHFIKSILECYATAALLMGILISWNLCSLPLIYISCPPGEWQHYLKIKSLLPKQSTGPGSNLESSHPLCAELASFPLYLFAFCMQTHTYFIFKRIMLCLSFSIHNDVLRGMTGHQKLVATNF